MANYKGQTSQVSDFSDFYVWETARIWIHRNYS